MLLVTLCYKWDFSLTFPFISDLDVGIMKHICILVNVYVDLLVFTRIAGTT